MNDSAIIVNKYQAKLQRKKDLERYLEQLKINSDEKNEIVRNYEIEFAPFILILYRNYLRIFGFTVAILPLIIYLLNEYSDENNPKQTKEIINRQFDYDRNNYQKLKDNIFIKEPKKNSTPIKPPKKKNTSIKEPKKNSTSIKPPKKNSTSIKPLEKDIDINTSDFKKWNRVKTDLKKDGLLTNTTINGISIGMDIADFHKLQGESNYIVKRTEFYEYIFLDKEKIRVSSKDKFAHIWELETISSKYKTYHGLRVHDELIKYYKIYPTDNRIYVEEEEGFLYLKPLDYQLPNNGIVFMIHIELEDEEEMLKKMEFNDYYYTFESIDDIVGYIKRFIISKVE